MIDKSNTTASCVDTHDHDSKHDWISVACKLFALLLAIALTVFGTKAFGGELPKVTNTTTTIALDSGVVPVLNPWNVRLGVDSIVLVPAHESRSISHMLMERNACIEISAAQRTIIQDQKRIIAIDSSSIDNLKKQGTLKDSLVVLERGKSSASKWAWFGGGTATGTLVGAVLVTIVVMLTR